MLLPHSGWEVLLQGIEQNFDRPLSGRPLLKTDNSCAADGLFTRYEALHQPVGNGGQDGSLGTRQLKDDRNSVIIVALAQLMHLPKTADYANRPTEQHSGLIRQEGYANSPCNSSLPNGSTRFAVRVHGQGLPIHLLHPAGQVGGVVNDVGQHRAVRGGGVAEPVAVHLDPAVAPARHPWVRPRVGPTACRVRLDPVQRLAHGPQKATRGAVAVTGEIVLEQGFDLRRGDARLPDHGSGGSALRGHGPLAGEMIIEPAFKSGQHATGIFDAAVAQVVCAAVQRVREVKRYVRVVQCRAGPLLGAVHAVLLTAAGWSLARPTTPVRAWPPSS